jgi:tetratricopeptide (TPR) repeat protein
MESGLAWQIQNQLWPDYPVSRTQYVSHRNRPRLEAFESYIRGLLSRDRSQKIKYLRSTSVLDPRFTESAFVLGMIYYKDHDYRTAILWLSKIRSSDPDYLEANYFLGLSYLYQAQYDRAAASFRVVEKELPLDELYNNLGIALERSDRPGSIFYFEKAVASDPTDRDYQFNLGYAHWKRGEFGQAAEHLLTSLEGNSSFSPSRRAILIDCLSKLGRAQEAEHQTHLLAGAVLESDLTQLKNLEQPSDEYDGVSFRHLRRLMQIQEELKHARLSESEHIELHFSSAMEDLKQGLDRQAIQELQQVIDYNPQDARAYLELAKIHFRTGRNDDAENAITRSLQWEQSSKAFVLLARIHLTLGRPEEALGPIDAALALDSSSSEAIKLKEDLNARTVSR